MAKKRDPKHKKHWLGFNIGIDTRAIKQGDGTFYGEWRLGAYPCDRWRPAEGAFRSKSDAHGSALVVAAGEVAKITKFMFGANPTQVLIDGDMK